MLYFYVRRGRPVSLHYLRNYSLDIACKPRAKYKTIPIIRHCYVSVYCPKLIYETSDLLTMPWRNDAMPWREFSAQDEIFRLAADN